MNDASNRLSIRHLQKKLQMIQKLASTDLEYCISKGQRTSNGQVWHSKADCVGTDQKTESWKSEFEEATTDL